MNRTRIAALAAALAVMAVAGCASGDDGPTQAESDYVALVRGTLGEVGADAGQATDAELLEAGWDACGRFDEDMDWVDVALAAQNEEPLAKHGIDPDAGVTVMVGAATTLCPEHHDAAREG